MSTSRTPIDDAQRHYDRVTAAWRHLMGANLHYGYFTSPNDPLDVATAALTRAMATRAALQAGDVVLDIGCGIGEPAIQLAREYGCRVHGISTSAVGVSEANARAIAAGLSEQIAFSARDALSTGFPAQRFDVAWVLESSHLMADKAGMIAEAARVMKPGGRFVLCDIIVHRDLTMPEVMRRARTFDLLRRVFGRAKMETLASYMRWLGEAGLVVAQVEDVSDATAPTFARWATNAERFAAEVSAALGPAAHADFVHACVELTTLWKERILGYGIITAAKPAGGHAS